MISTLDTVGPELPPLVRLHEVWVYRGGKAILQGVSADIPRSRVTGLIGLNGSGKSTLLRTLLGEFPYRGRIEFRCGHDHSRPRPEYVGYVPQRLAIDARLPITVRDLLALALTRRPLFFGISRQVLSRIRELLAQVGVDDLIDVPVEGLSGGQLQRILLAMALEPKPELLLLDEPAAGIDFKTQQSFYDLISELNRQTGVTIVLVSHDLDMVKQYACSVLCLKDGRIVAEGPPASVLSHDSLAGIYGRDLRTLGQDFLG